MATHYPTEREEWEWAMEDQRKLYENRIAELEAKLAAQGSATPAVIADWQPIETAPQDEGAWILGFESGAYMVIHWSGDTLGRFKAWRDDEYFERQPTHWMPLPDPPSGTPEEG